MQKDSIVEDEEYMQDFVQEQEDFSRVQTQEQREQSFNQLYLPDKPEIQKEDREPKFQEEIPQSIETMFIIFSYFKGEIEEIGIENGCKLKIILNKIKITSINATEEQFENCSKKIKEKVGKIVYIKMTTVKDRIKIYNSPFFCGIAKKEKLGFTKFDKQIYAFSNKLTQNQLKIKVKNICFGNIIFQTPFKPYKSKDVPIYDHIRSFIRKIIQENRISFEQRSVRVQLSNSLDTVQMIGQRQADCMYARNLMKNTFQSMVVVVIKDQEILRPQGQKRLRTLQKYVSKISKYPIHLGPIGQNILSIISKDNILQKLFKKEKFLKELSLNSKKQFGMFIPWKFSFAPKIAVIQEICNKNGYDFTNNLIYYYFKRVFIPQNEEHQATGTLKIFGEVLQAWKDVKQKYEVIFKKRYQENNPIYEQFSGEYYFTGENEEDVEASKALRRDVMKDLIKMGKKSLVRYNVFEGEQKRTYWFEDQKGKTVVDLEKIGFEKGRRYFKGKTKVAGNQSEFLYEAELKMI